MTNLSRLEKARGNANARKFLDLISYAEGTQGNDYHTAFGGGRLGHLNDHPKYLKKFKQTDGKTNKTSAAGRYQFLTGTWNGLVKKYGFKDFGERNQDLGALSLIADMGALVDIEQGRWKEAVRKIGGIWASFPTSKHPQPRKSWSQMEKFMGRTQQPKDVASTDFTPQMTTVDELLKKYGEKQNNNSNSALSVPDFTPQMTTIDALKNQYGDPASDMSNTLSTDFTPQMTTVDELMKQHNNSKSWQAPRSDSERMQEYLQDLRKQIPHIEAPLSYQPKGFQQIKQDNSLMGLVPTPQQSQKQLSDALSALEEGRNRG